MMPFDFAQSIGIDAMMKFQQALKATGDNAIILVSMIDGMFRINVDRMMKNSM